MAAPGPAGWSWSWGGHGRQPPQLQAGGNESREEAHGADLKSRLHDSEPLGDRGRKERSEQGKEVIKGGLDEEAVTGTKAERRTSGRDGIFTGKISGICYRFPVVFFCGGCSAPLRCVCVCV